jgi:hypothetical protein
MEDSSKLAPEDEAAIRALLDRMGQAWARGDGEAYASVFSEDATQCTSQRNHAGAVLLLDCARSIGQTTTPQSLLWLGLVPQDRKGA